MYTNEEQAEAIRAITRKYGMTEELNPRAYHLLQALELVNVGKSDITCLGKCKNGGTCQRHIAKEYAIKGLLGVMGVVFEPSIQGDDLEACLEVRFMHLLCTQQHKAGAQAAACVDNKIDSVERFRNAYGIGCLPHQSQYSCAASVQTSVPFVENFPSPIDWKAAYEALSANYTTLETEKGFLEEEVDYLQNEIKNLQREKADTRGGTKHAREALRKVEEENAALEIENRVLQMENEELKRKTKSVRDTLGLLHLRLQGQESDAEQHRTLRTTGERRPTKQAPSITSKSLFESTFHSGKNGVMKRPTATPRDPLTSSSAIWSPKPHFKQSFDGIGAVPPEGGVRPSSSSSSRNSSVTIASGKHDKKATMTQAPYTPYGSGVGARCPEGGVRSYSSTSSRNSSTTPTSQNPEKSIAKPNVPYGFRVQSRPADVGDIVHHGFAQVRSH